MSDLRPHEPGLRGLWLAALGCALSLAGCGQQPPPAAAAPAAAGTAKAAAPPVVAGPLLEECRRFAEEFLKAAGSGKSNRLNELINWPALLGRATQGIAAPPASQQRFIERGLQAAHDNRSFSARLVQTIKLGGKLRFLRIHSAGADRRVLFRLVRQDGGLGYFDFVLQHDPLGQVRIIDVDALQDGQLLSQILRETYLQTLATDDPRIVASLVGDDRDLAEAAPQLAIIGGFRKAGHFPEALRAFDELPREVRSRKVFQRLHVAVAEGLGGKVYAEALEQFRRRYPEDPSVALLAGDYYLRTKQYDQAAACIRLLDADVADPYLDVMLARLYLQAGQPAAAREAADHAIRRAPRELEPYEVRLSVSLVEKQFADTARLLHFIGT
ncbi:MAG TPA: hypothetical protein VHY20_10845, partial [Pirellulales bacterium]|nr:hypothetical protein [Pirellulales bacterium]